MTIQELFDAGYGIPEYTIKADTVRIRFNDSAKDYQAREVVNALHLMEGFKFPVYRMSDLPDGNL
jgi:hypothetical protein